jgi:hypothetical protein
MAGCRFALRHTSRLSNRLSQARVDYDDTLLYMYGVLTARMGDILVATIQGAASWDEMESAVHCLRAIADNVAMQPASSPWIPLALEKVLALPQTPELLLYEVTLTIGVQGKHLMCIGHQSSARAPNPKTGCFFMLFDC